MWQNVVEEEAYVPAPVAVTYMLDQDETESVNKGKKPGEPSSSMRPCKRKRPRVVEVQNNKMVDMMSSFFTEVNSQIGSLVSKVGAEKEGKGQRQNLVKELADLPLSLEDKITAAMKICGNREHLDIFMD